MPEIRTIVIDKVFSVDSSQRKFSLRILCLAALLVTLLGSMQALRAETIYAPDCSQAAVQGAIDSSATGDTVIIPSGECTWSGSVSIPNDRKITLAGMGMDETVITREPQGNVLSLNRSGSRVTGIGFTNGLIVTEGYDFRIDHCRVSLADWSNGITVQSRNIRSPNTHTSQGVIDNCIFENMRVLAGGTNYMLGGDDSQHDLWINSLDLGGEEAVYIEDNVFTGGTNAVDANYGGRFVFRYNTVTDSDIEAHSVQGDNRATRKWEIYRNNIRQTEGFQQVFLRGGTGVFFDNDLSGTVYFRLDNVRSFRDGGSNAGRCDGTSSWDGNLDETGWPCRDQIGTGGDMSRMSGLSNGPTQILVPAYFWNNYRGGSLFSAGVVNDSGEHIKPNRDFYDFVNSGFDGSEGVGRGTYANRPETCTPGVGYWATDRGSWNRSGSGGQGALYTCNEDSQWELHYVPYAYPHPLRSSSTAKPQPPSDLSVGQ